MWISKRLDLSWADFAAGLAGCLMPNRRERWAEAVERLWSANDDAIACLSVRSGFDLWLAAAQFPPGSEIVFSALTIADMPRIVRHHGLVPVPIDIDPETTNPSLAQLRGAVADRTRAIVVTHLYGARLNIEAVVELAREKNVLLVEDCAQAYGGPSFTGHPESDVTMFSFGPIKTATALGGGLLRVRDPAVLDRMRALQRAYPRQSAAGFAGRLLKYAGLHLVSGPSLYGFLIRAVRLAGSDHDRMMHRLTRGFSGPTFFNRIRHRPCGALLRLLARRLREDGSRLAQRTRAGERLLQLLPGDVRSPAGRIRPHHYWVFPILAHNPRVVIEALRRAGFDATEGRSLDVVEPPEPSAGMHLAGAREILEHTVFLPFYPGIPARGWERMADVVRQVLGGTVTEPVPAPPVE